MRGPIGIIVNPAAGKDVRRLVARASVATTHEKVALVRRLAAGAIAGGAVDILYMPDAGRIAEHALGDRALTGMSGLSRVRPVEMTCEGTVADTVRAAELMAVEGCELVVSLGGDGTNRAIASGWRGAPLIAITAGTNNVFPRPTEATMAGVAAGLVATGAVLLADVGRRAKMIVAEIDGAATDLALVDAVLLGERFIGARAIWETAALRAAVLTRAEPTSIGIASIGGMLLPLSPDEDAGLVVEFGPGGTEINAPIAPGMFRRVAVAHLRKLAFNERYDMIGPGVLAFDGERERVLGAGQRACLRVGRDGPVAIDVGAVLERAAREGLFRLERTGGRDAH